MSASSEPSGPILNGKKTEALLLLCKLYNFFSPPWSTLFFEHLLLAVRHKPITTDFIVCLKTILNVMCSLVIVQSRRSYHASPPRLLLPIGKPGLGARWIIGGNEVYMFMFSIGHPVAEVTFLPGVRRKRGSLSWHAASQRVRLPSVYGFLLHILKIKP